MTLWMMTAALAIPSTAQNSLFGKPPPPPDPAAGLRVKLSGNLAWRGALAEFRPDEGAILNAAWRSTAGVRAKRELGLSEEATNQSLKFVNPPGEGPTLELTLASDTQKAREEGERFLSSVAADVVSDALAHWAQSINRAPVLHASDRLETARKEYEEARARASQCRREVRDIAEVLDPSPEAVRGATARLEQERQRIRLDLIGQNARQKALQDRVAKLSDAAVAKASDDPIAAELAGIVKLREAEVSRLASLYKTGQAPAQERDHAEVQLADAKAKLLERRETAARSAGTELLTDLNKELITLSITTVENDARLEYLDQRLKALTKASDRIEDLEQFEAATARAAKRLESAESELQSARRQLESGGTFSASITWSKPSIEQIPKTMAPPKQP